MDDDTVFQAEGRYGKTLRISPSIYNGEFYLCNEERNGEYVGIQLPAAVVLELSKKLMIEATRVLKEEADALR